jgi:hypothetical protein
MAIQMRNVVVLCARCSAAAAPVEHKIGWTLLLVDDGEQPPFETTLCPECALDFREFVADTPMVHR